MPWVRAKCARTQSRSYSRSDESDRTFWKASNMIPTLILFALVLLAYGGLAFLLGSVQMQTSWEISGCDKKFSDKEA